MSYNDKKYIIATDHIQPDTGADASAAIQSLIDSNPNRTIFFPDGVYCLEHPILTPAHPKKSVDLQLSNYACFKAAANWSGDEAMIRLGAKDPANNISIPGSNYGICGGIIDGSGVAVALSIDGGRETYVRNINIKNTVLGLHIKRGANNGSSDADISSVNIVGNGSEESMGVLIEGFDNTLTNLRIANVFIGVEVRSGGNMLRNIHPLFYLRGAPYKESIGFSVKDSMNWFDYCYSDQFSVGFDTVGGGIYKNCFCWWYSDKDPLHVAMRSREPFFGTVDTLMIGGMYASGHPNRFMETDVISDTADVRNVVICLNDGSRRVINGTDRGGSEPG